MGKAIYPELSYDLVGIVFKVFNDLGYGYQEKTYQKAIALELKNKEVKFQEQLYSELEYDKEKIAHFYLDFLIEEKIVLELKVGKDFHKRDFEQILSYLKTKKLKLGILVIFTPKGVKYKRILNLY